MNEFLRKFDTIRFVAPWSIFRNFLGIFHFFNSNLNFEFGPVWYRPKPEPGRTGLTGNRSNRTSSHRFGEPWFQPCASFGFFQIGHLPFTKIAFLDMCQKTVSTHAPQFWSNRSVAPNLLLIITANIQIYINLPIRWCIESPFCPRAKVINISIFFSAGTSPVAPPLPSLFKNTLTLPPPLQLPRVSRIQIQELPLRQCLPSPRSQRYVFFLYLHLCPPPFFFPIS